MPEQQALSSRRGQTSPCDLTTGGGQTNAGGQTTCHLDF